MSDFSGEVAGALIRLASADIEERIGGVEDLAHLSDRLIDYAIGVFEAPGEARFPIFERLGRFGSLAIDPLEQLLTRTEDPELRVLTSAALLALGSSSGVETLLSAVQPTNDYVCVAARVLGDAGVAEAEPVIRQAIQSCDPSNTAVLECLVKALRRLSGSLPEDVRSRLRLIEPPWLRDALLR